VAHGLSPGSNRRKDRAKPCVHHYNTTQFGVARAVVPILPTPRVRGSYKAAEGFAYPERHRVADNSIAEFGYPLISQILKIGC